MTTRPTSSLLDYLAAELYRTATCRGFRRWLWRTPWLAVPAIVRRAAKVRNQERQAYHFLIHCRALTKRGDYDRVFELIGAGLTEWTLDVDALSRKLTASRSPLPPLTPATASQGAAL